MTINTEVRIAGPYTGDGIVTTFPFAFKVFKTSDVFVVSTNLSGIDTTLILGTDYTVSLNSNQNTSPGGNIVTNAPLTLDFLLTATSEVPYTQGQNITNRGGFFPAVINDALDRLTILVQQVKTTIGRTVTVPLSDGTDVSTVLPSATVRANKTLVFDGAGNFGVSADDYTDNAAAAAGSAASALTYSNNSASSATASASSATASAASATLAATSANSASSTSLWWKFASSTTMADPGTGLVRFNNATPASITQIALSYELSNNSNPNYLNYILTWDDSSSPVKGVLILTNVGVPGSFCVFQINGPIVNNTTWVQIPVTFIGNTGGVGSPNDTYDIKFYRTGDSGGRVLLDTKTASSTSAFVFDNTKITTAYSKYIVEILGITASTSGSNLRMMFSTDNGSTYVTASVYGHIDASDSSSPAYAAGVMAASDEVNLTYIPSGTFTHTAEITLLDVSVAANTKILGSGVTKCLSTLVCKGDVDAILINNSVINTVKVEPTSGTMVSGIVNLYALV